MILIFLSVLLTCCYGLSKLITGAVGFFVFSVIACALFSWQYLTVEVPLDTLSIFESTSNLLSALNLPVAIFTFVMSILSGLYLLIANRGIE